MRYLIPVAASLLIGLVGLTSALNVPALPPPSVTPMLALVSSAQHLDVPMQGGAAVLTVAGL